MRLIVFDNKAGNIYDNNLIFGSLISISNLKCNRVTTFEV